MTPETLTLLQTFIKAISSASDLSWVKAKFDEFLLKTDPQDALFVAGAFALANPFYLPTMEAQSAERLKIGFSEFAATILRAKLTASRAHQTNILVACSPKSASTFISGSLRRSLNLPDAKLMAPSLHAQTIYSMGITLREQETDELALIQHGTNGIGYVAQHHVRCTPYLCRQLDLYKIRPIVTYRNVFDSIRSLDDMILSQRMKQDVDRPVEQVYFADSLPLKYPDLDEETRLGMLVERYGAWYLHFYLSWKRCEAMGLVKPFWISYERDFLGDKEVLARRLAAFLGEDIVSGDTLATCFSDMDSAKKERLNKGVAGRGSQMPDSIRARVLAAFEPYFDEADFSEIL
ncbi:hypothetical protein HGO38_23930 [Rhizobium sp. CG5]|uniref:hypothetical protein n=1 Tax=Rhizobium sp. CG5 TaxID=2726076 RepID=UPI0020336DFD|nr:hypothetical protein [Rhizobium sp. CG5]MCM2476499.1 hypothetical protein [Rhizobium sp. CG5]